MALMPGEGFPEKLEAALKAKGHDVVIANAGVSGDTTSGGLSRLDWSVPEGTELVILELGANDMLRGVAPDITARTLTRCWRGSSSAASASCLPACAPRPISGLISGSASTHLSAPCQEYGVALYPFFLDGVAADRPLLLDGRHASERVRDRPHGRARAAGRGEDAPGYRRLSEPATRTAAAAYTPSAAILRCGFAQRLTFCPCPHPIRPTIGETPSCHHLPSGMRRRPKPGAS